MISENPIHIKETKTGRLIMLPPTREATEQDKINLHRLVAKLLYEDYIETGA